MRTRTLTELTTDVRRRADIEGVTDRFPDAEVQDYINASIAQLYETLDRTDYTYYMSTQTISTANGTQNYNLNADFWRCKGVTVVIAPNIQVRARKFAPAQGPWLRSTGPWLVSMPIYYRIRGKDPFSGANKDAGVVEQIEFAPTPSSTYSIYVDYVKAPQKLTAGADAFDGMAGYDEFVVLDAAIKIKRKNRLDCADLMADRDRILEGWIKSAAADRDQAEPETIQDVQTDLWFQWPYGA